MFEIRPCCPAAGMVVLTIEVDDGGDLSSWLARYHPANPLDPILLNGDPDVDGVKILVERMPDSDPTFRNDGVFLILAGG